MSERIIDGRPKLPAPEERPALPPPEGEGGGRGEGDGGEARERDDDGEDRHDDAARPWYKRRRFWTIVAIVAVLALAAWWLLGRGGGQGGGEGEEKGGRPPAVVSVARAQTAEWGAELTAVGTVRAIQGVDVTTELAGTVAAIRFANGQNVRRGETLVLLDTSTERAQLRALIAGRDQARLAFDRALRLIERGAIAQAEVEQAEANFESLQAQVEQVRTTIAKKRIEAPFSGKIGIRLVSLGQYLAPGAAIVNLQQIAPIFVNFELPENTVGRVREGQPVSLRVDAYGGRTFRGRINALNAQIAANTRNLTVQALVPNPDRTLRPGMFADVTVDLPGTRRVLVVPATAVTTNAYGESVFLVARPDPRRERQKQARAKQAEEEEGGFFKSLFGGGGAEGEGEGGGGSSGEEGGSEKGSGEQKAGQGGQQQSRYVARTAFIKTGERRGLMVEITQGLRPGQPVVTAGQLKLEEDAPVQISRQDARQGANPRPNRY